MAKDKNCTPVQIAIAWVMSQRDFIVPIPGTKRIKYLEENIGALNVNLNEGDLKYLNEAAPLGFTKGLRYPALAMNALNK